MNAQNTPKYTTTTTHQKTVIKRLSDGKTITLEGKPELQFLREKAYIAGDNTKTGAQWAAETDALAAKFFDGVH